MSIASLVVAVTYLLLILVGILGALFLVVWLFGEPPTEARTRKSQTTKSVRNVNLSGTSKLATPTEIQRPEDRAA